jgi:hypothetical protein
MTAWQMTTSGAPYRGTIRGARNVCGEKLGDRRL